MADVSIYVIAAMCGCWKRESGVNPGVWESLIPCAWDYQYEYTGQGGYGLGQWTNVGESHGRLYRLHTWVTENGYEDGDGNGQLAYLPVEGYWNGEYNGTGDNAKTRGSYGSLANFLASTSTNIANLVWDFLANWEGVPGDAYSERLQWANNILTYLQNHAGETGTWTSSNAYISYSKMYQNCLCVYNWFNGYVPDPEPTPEPEPEKDYTIKIVVNGSGTARASATSANEGDEIKLYADPIGNATFEYWHADEGEVQFDDTEGETSGFTMPAENVIISANFTGITYFPIWLLYQWDRLRRAILYGY